MANVIIAHPDGRTYSTTPEGFKKLYEAQGFEIVGDETPASFQPVGIPAPRPARKKARPKVSASARARARAAAAAKKAAAPANTPEPESAEQPGE